MNTTRRPNAPASPVCWPICRRPVCTSGISKPAKAALNRSSCRWWRKTHELARHSRDLRLRNGAHFPHHRAVDRLSGAVDSALFRRLRRCHRRAHPVGRGHFLRRLHRAGPDHADAAAASGDQCQLRHLFPEIHRHDLRASVGTDVVRRDRDRLCRRGGDQGDHDRADHPCHLDASSSISTSCTRSG